jgi:hypothetical protein
MASELWDRSVHANSEVQSEETLLSHGANPLWVLRSDLASANSWICWTTNREAPELLRLTLRDSLA